MSHTDSQGLPLLFVDLECTCNDDPSMPGPEMEIIEIGAVVGYLGQQEFVIVDECQFYVQPQWHNTLSSFCTSLTGIEQEQVENAPLLQGVTESFRGWISQHKISTWVSWGKFDQRQFTTETNLKHLENPLESLQHLNIKQLFARKRGHRVGLARAVQLSGLQFQGRHHSGLDDAKNIAQLIAHDEVLREAVLVRAAS